MSIPPKKGLAVYQAVAETGKALNKPVINKAPAPLPQSFSAFLPEKEQDLPAASPAVLAEGSALSENTADFAGKITAYSADILVRLEGLIEKSTACLTLCRKMATLTALLRPQV